jgi:hypothetical protein
LRQNRRRDWTPSQNRTSRMHLKNGRSTGNDACVQKGTTSRVVMEASRPKVISWLDDSTSPWNYGYHIFLVWAKLYSAHHIVHTITYTCQVGTGDHGWVMNLIAGLT